MPIFSKYILIIFLSPLRTSISISMTWLCRSNLPLDDTCVKDKIPLVIQILAALSRSRAERHMFLVPWSPGNFDLVRVTARGDVAGIERNGFVHILICLGRSFA